MQQVQQQHAIAMQELETDRSDSPVLNTDEVGHCCSPPPCRPSASSSPLTLRNYACPALSKLFNAAAWIEVPSAPSSLGELFLDDTQSDIIEVG